MFFFFGDTIVHMLFNNKVVIITGGSKGVGAATAHLFANSGANLILVARDKDNLDYIVKKLELKVKIMGVAMDVSDTDACVALLEKVKSQFGRIDILVNNAGYHSRGLVENIDVNDLSKMIDINLKAPIILSRLAIPYLKEAGGLPISLSYPRLDAATTLTPMNKNTKIINCFKCFIFKTIFQKIQKFLSPKLT